MALRLVSRVKPLMSWYRLMKERKWFQIISQRWGQSRKTRLKEMPCFSTRSVLHINRTPESLQQDINDLQAELFKRGLLKKCSGRFDEETLAAVKEFQRQNSLRIDGIVGALTWAALCHPTLSLLMEEKASAEHSASIQELQKLLSEEGFKVKPTGKFDRDTDKALRRFQRRYGLLADGVCGPVTWRMLLGQRLMPDKISWLSDVLPFQVGSCVAQLLTIVAIWIGIVLNPYHLQQELSLVAALAVAYSLTIIGPLLLERISPRLLVYENQPLFRYAPYVLVGFLWRPILRGVVAILK